MNRNAPAFRRRRSSARLWEQLREYFEVRFRAEKYGVPYFLAESEAKQSGPRKEAVGARARNAVEDLNGGYRREALGGGRCKVANYLRIWAAPRKLSANGSTLFANGESRSVMICGWGTLFMQ